MPDLKAVTAILEEMSEHEGEDYCLKCASYTTSRHVKGGPGQSGDRCWTCDEFIVHAHIRQRKLRQAALDLVGGN